MTVEEKKNKSIEKLAQASYPLMLPYKFVPIGKLKVMGKETDSQIGELYYMNLDYEIGAAVRVKDWVFVLERMTNEARKKLALKLDPDMWEIGGFYNKSHYSFISLKNPSQDERNKMLVKYVVEKFWSILYIEFFLSYLEEHKEDQQDFQVIWELCPLK